MNWFSVNAAARGKGGGEIKIYGPIGRGYGDPAGTGAKAFVDALDSLIKAGPGDIHIKIHSPGGDVGDGMAIYNAIRAVSNRVVCTVEGVAYSMASVIALAGRETRMYSTAQFMIHNPQGDVRGEEKDLLAALGALKSAKAVLLTAYAGKSGKPTADIESLMGATTWMSAQEAKDFGFVDTIVNGEAQRIAACFDVNAWTRFYRGGAPLPSPTASHAAAVDVCGMIGEIRATCPGASAEFILSHLEAGSTTAEATAARNIELLAEVEALRSQIKAPTTTTIGVAALGAADPSIGYGDAVDHWKREISDRTQRGMTRSQAVADLAKRDPELNNAYVQAMNDRRRASA